MSGNQVCDATTVSPTPMGLAVTVSSQEMSRFFLTSFSFPHGSLRARLSHRHAHHSLSFKRQQNLHASFCRSIKSSVDKTVKRKQQNMSGSCCFPLKKKKQRHAQQNNEESHLQKQVLLYTAHATSARQPTISACVVAGSKRMDRRRFGREIGECRSV